MSFICAFVAVSCINLFFLRTQEHKWFLREGFYWVENGIVFIEKGKKFYELKNIKALVGTTISFMSSAKSGMLKIELENKKNITFVLSSKEPIKTFSDSKLLPLFEIILENNTALKKDEALDFAYKS